MCGNYAKLCTHKVGFGDAVLFVEHNHYVELYLFVSRSYLAVFLNIRRCAEDNVKSFAGESRAECTGILILSEVRKKVGNAENGVACFVADLYVNGSTVILCYNAVDCKRNCSPLVLSDTSLVVCLEISYAVVFKEGMLL